MSDMTIATGADHLVYGWVFFGIVIFLLFWVGSFFREDDQDEATVQAGIVDPGNLTGSSNGLLVVTFVSALLMAAVAPLLAHQVFGPASSERNSVAFPSPEGGWRNAAVADWGWRPVSRVSGQSVSFYRRGQDHVGIIVQFADGTIEGADVIGSNTLFTRDDSGWRVVDQDKVTIDSPDGELLVDVAQIRSASDSLLVWSWYVVGGVSTSNDYYAKLQQTLARLGFGDSVTYRVIVVTPVDLQHGDGAATLQEFVNDYGPLLYQSLRQATPPAP